MRGWGVVILMVLLVAAGGGGYLFKKHQDKVALQEARQRLLKQLDVDWQSLQQELPQYQTEGSMTVAYPDINFEMTMQDVQDVVILDSLQTKLLDGLLFRDFCNSILDGQSDNRENARQSFKLMKEDHVSVSAVFNNANGYLVYSKRFYVTECPQFDQLYRQVVK